MTGITARTAALLAFFMCATFALGPTGAKANPFEGGWTLDAQQSNLKFQSVKNETTVEVSSFATLVGEIDESGLATVRVLLDSVDTGIDLRNVRMRFLFFETFQFPEAKVTVQIDPAALDDLPTRRRKVMSVPYTLDLHGTEREAETDLAITLLTDDLVSVASTTPISVSAEEFGLSLGVTKLEEAAGVDIIPSATVSFDFAFTRGASTAPAVAVAASPDGTLVENVALETQGEFSREECVDRFETISRSGNIYFRSGSARLDDRSRPVLAEIAEIADRCPALNLEVAGHTDSDGSDAANQRLSERRAASVAIWLTEAGVAAERIATVGHGESQPAFPNDTAQNKERNRRIEFAVVN